MDSSTFFPLYNSTSQTDPSNSQSLYSRATFGPATSHNNMSTLTSAFNHPKYPRDSDNENQIPVSTYNHMSMLTRGFDFTTLNDPASNSDSDSASEVQVPLCWPRVCMLCPLYFSSKEKLYDHFRAVHDGKYCGENQVGGAMAFKRVGEYYSEARVLSKYGDGMDKDDYTEALALDADDESLADDCSEGYPLSESDYSGDIYDFLSNDCSDTLSNSCSPASEDMEDLVLDDFNDLWNDISDKETGTVMAHTCSICSHFFATQVELYLHFENEHSPDYSPGSVSEDKSESELDENENKDEEMSDAMDLDDDEDDDAKTVTPRNIRPCTAVDCQRTRTEKVENVQVWLGGLEKDDTNTPFSKKEEVIAQEEDLHTPTQMVFFRRTSENERDFLCGYCDREFTFQGELQIHLEDAHPRSQSPLTQTQVQKQQQPIFDIFSDTSLAALEEHIQYIHDTENLPEEWPVEEEVGMSREYREATPDEIATPTSSGYANYSCDFCMAGFGESDALLYHMVCVHSNF